MRRLPCACSSRSRKCSCRSRRRAPRSTSRRPKCASARRSNSKRWRKSMVIAPNGRACCAGSTAGILPTATDPMTDAVVTEPQTGAKTPAALREELLERAAALVPVLRERSAKAETLRRCPEETVEDFAAAGLLRICQPARWGGFELPWDVLCEVSRVLARGCGSQAWVGNIYCDHTQLLGMFDLEAQADVWGRDPGARLSASVEPAGKARPVPGGYVFSGRHRYASGIDYAHWLLCGGNLHEDGKAPRRSFYLVPKSDVTIIDDW